MTRPEIPTDLHNHVLPGVDDGAQDVEEGLSALETLAAEGVRRVVASPHFRASHFERGRGDELLGAFDAAFDELATALEGSGLDIELDRGCEFKLDAPRFDLTDPRLRLGGGPAVLVEFSSFQVPPFGGNQLAAVRDAGWVPVLAHPERYSGAERALDRFAQWVDAGVRLQVNAPSLVGRYGARARAVARDLFREGLVCVVASDYHALGGPELEAARSILRAGRIRADARPASVDALEAAVDALFSVNPSRLLAGIDPVPVSPIEVDDGSA